MAPAPAAGGAPKLTTNDALAYLKAVKDIFQDKREKYDEFLEVMKDFKSQRIDTNGVIMRVKELFKGHRDLILGFNTFLPKGYEIKLPEEKRPVEFEEAISFVNKIKNRFQNDEHSGNDSVEIKNRFQNDEHVYKSFLDILNMYRRENKSIHDVYQEVAALFQNHHDLLEEFTHFLPDASATMAPQHVSFGRAFMRRDERSSVMPTVRHVHGDKRERTYNSHADRDFSVDRPDPEHDRQRRRAEKEKDRKEDRDRRDRERDDKDLEHDSRELDNGQRRRKPSSRRVDDSVGEHLHQGGESAENFGMYNISASSFDDKNALKSVYTQEFNFCERVKEKLHPETYQEFLKCLHIYSKEIITRTELKNLVSDILEKYPDLMDGFNEFLAHCENMASLRNEGHVARPVKLEDRDRERERDERERDRERERDKERERLDKALLAEIKEISEKKRKEDDVLLAIAAGNRRPIVPNMEFEYVDSDIHEDLYQIIKYSCGEVCASSDQLEKVMRIWTTFLEPMLGVKPRPQGAEDSEDMVKPKTRAVKNSMANVGESNSSPGADGATATKQSNGDESIPPEQAVSCRARLANGDAAVTDNGFLDVDRNARRGDNLSGAPLHGRVQGNAPTADEMSGVTVQTASTERLTDNVSPAGRAEPSHARTNLEITSGVSATTSKAGQVGNEIAFDSRASNEVLPSSEGGVSGRPNIPANGGCTAESNKEDRLDEGSAAHNNFKVEREEGELSPNGDFEEDNFVAFEDSTMDAVPKPKDGSTSRQYQVRPGGVEACCGEAAGENDADADDEGEESAQRSTEDSENASEAGDDVSGSESGDGEECSREDHEEEEEDGDHDDQDAKAESEGEAEGMADANDAEGEITSLPFSERFLHTVKPLAKHVPAALRDKEDKCLTIFYGNDSFYVLLRLHQTLYERILSAKTNSSAAEKKWRTSKDTSPPDLYAKFMSALYNLLDGSADNTKFEDDCRAIIGTQSYVLFTLDKLIYKVVKQLQAIASDEMENKLLHLYLYEKSRKPESFCDLVYHENAQGELSPNGDFEEDNFVAFEDSTMDAVPKPKDGSTSRQYQVRPGGVEACCGEAAGENDADADDEGEESAQRSTEDSENASEAGDDVSGSESGDGEECSREDHEEEEEDGDHDDQDAKAESEGEAEGMADANDAEGEITSLPFSERFLHTVKPLAKHVPAALRDKEDKCLTIFYGNDSFYVLLRLHQTLYERILSAKTNSSAAEKKWRTSKDTSPPDLYAKFMSALYNLLDGSADNTKFEDDCRAIIGTQSYVLFTLDKLIYKVVKQLQAIASDEMENKLLHLYLYEKSRKPESFCDLVYHENARVLLHDESIYRFECTSNPTRLSIQLMEYGHEKPEVTAVSIDPNFSAYLYGDFLSCVPDRKGSHCVFLKRNKRKFGSEDEYSTTCKVMSGILVVNGLECKISCSSSKVSYVLDTEDFLFRGRKKRRCSNGDTASSQDLYSRAYKAWGALLGRRLAERGVIVACIDYRNFPQGTISDMVKDASQGISFVCNNIASYGGDPNRKTINLDLSLAMIVSPKQSMVDLRGGERGGRGYKAWGALLGRRLAERGVIVACIDYRNFPQGTISDMVKDASQGISFVCNNIASYGGDPNRKGDVMSDGLDTYVGMIYLIGQSAGAHIAACALLDQAIGESGEGESISWSVSQIKAYFGISGGKTFTDALQNAGAQAELVLYEGKTHTDLFLQDPLRGGRDELLEDIVAVVHADDTVALADDDGTSPAARRLVPECMLQLAHKISPF
ncbi:hypothetical protein COCNU_05G009660 [Cocos nucifera]|uniref:protein-S-isoprenylcysteine alpha-carbonyl methylesterase n=1 Tax=Cocos nucifera TaxID=13894 RepID=A0A8K0I929_COCNU|nr:hypothetical protein COCNU_05G009660 [Cocos nucifera]